MARKLRGFERVLDAPSLFAIAYGEIASSLYIALGIVAGAALGLTPLVLLVTGAIFVLVSLSYAEGTAALPETGGAATFVRRAFNDLAGFVTGLGALPRLPHRDGALGRLRARTTSPAPSARRRSASRRGTRSSAARIIVVIAGVRLARTTRSTSARSPSRCSTSSCRALLVLLGLAFLLSPETLVDGLGFAERAGLERPRLRAPARDARVHGPRDGRQPRRGGDESPAATLPRSLFSAIGLVVVVTVLIGAIGLSAYPVSNGETALGERVARAAARRDRSVVRRVAARPCSSTCSKSRSASPGVLILVAAATTSFSGITRLTYSLAEHGSLPREFARLERRAVVSSEAIAHRRRRSRSG